jgi:hypothetical protein
MLRASASFTARSCCMYQWCQQHLAAGPMANSIAVCLGPAQVGCTMKHLSYTASVSHTMNTKINQIYTALSQPATTIKCWLIRADSQGPAEGPHPRHLARLDAAAHSSCTLDAASAQQPSHRPYRQGNWRVLGQSCLSALLSERTGSKLCCGSHSLWSTPTRQTCAM